MNETIAGLDIGTDKICALAGEASPDGGVNLTGAGIAGSRGFRKGMLVDLDAAVSSIAEAVEEAERQSGVEIKRAAAGISGTHVQGINASGFAMIPGRGVKSQDIEKAVANAEEMFIPPGREVLHAEAYAYRIDEQREIRDPVGMQARNLEVSVYFITAAANPYENFLNCLKSAGIETECLVFQPLASVYSVLTDDEKELGTVLLDIGGGTTGIALMEEGFVRFAGVVPVGGGSITDDIAVCLGLPRNAAEKVKREYGRAEADGAPLKKIKLHGTEHSASVKLIAEIIEARAEEILELAGRELARGGAGAPACGAVLTGGGALLEGLKEKAERFLNMPVRIGAPGRCVSGIEKIGTGPSFSAAAGLACICLSGSERRGGLFSPGAGMFQGINRKVKTWFKDFL